VPRIDPAAWVCRFAPLIRPGGHVLDVAAGRGRHTRLLLDMGFAVTAVDRNIDALRSFTGDKCSVHAIDLEAGSAEDVLQELGSSYDGIVVASYLHRPLFRWLVAALAPGGVLIYETFALGNERFGRPSSPEFLLRPGELLEAFAALTVIAFEQGEVSHPSPAVKQRIAALAGPVGRLPEPAPLDKARPKH
jgi:SAM-dependent methyltransferase